LSNAVADFNMAFAYLQGRGVARDLALSREHFGRAADAGHLQAKRILVALLANGTTGGRDWQAAMQRLHELKSSGDAQAVRQIELRGLMNLDAQGDPKQVFDGKRLSDRPEVTLFADLFTEAERRYLMDAALPAYRPATVGHVAGGHTRQIVQQIRTCDVAVSERQHPKSCGRHLPVVV